jgi:hypothetical protein
MRHLLGLLLLLAVGVFAAWGLWKLYGPRPREQGMRIRLRKDDDS